MEKTVGNRTEKRKTKGIEMRQVSGDMFAMIYLRVECRFQARRALVSRGESREFGKKDVKVKVVPSVPRV